VDIRNSVVRYFVEEVRDANQSLSAKALFTAEVHGVWLGLGSALCRARLPLCRAERVLRGVFKTLRRGMKTLARTRQTLARAQRTLARTRPVLARARRVLFSTQRVLARGRRVLARAGRVLRGSRRAGDAKIKGFFQSEPKFSGGELRVSGSPSELYIEAHHGPIHQKHQKRHENYETTLLSLRK
jgi:hypothetical protein